MKLTVLIERKKTPTSPHRLLIPALCQDSYICAGEFQDTKDLYAQARKAASLTLQKMNDRGYDTTQIEDKGSDYYLGTVDYQWCVDFTFIYYNF